MATATAPDIATATATATTADLSTAPATDPTTEILLRIEQRLTAIEAALAEIRVQLPSTPGKLGWLENVIGSMKDEPAFSEVIALGRAYREADVPSDQDEL